MGDFTQVLGLTAVFSIMFLIGYAIWRIVWFNKYGVELPFDKNFNIQEINRRKVFMKTKTFSIFWSTFSQLLKKLDMEYWATHCGCDGYLYLLFQRRFLKLTLYLSGITFILSFIMNVFDDDRDSVSILDHATLNNKKFKNFRSWIHVFMVFVYTFLTIRAVQKTRRDAKVAYQMYYTEMSQNKDSEWLKARTLHVKGMPKEDRTGNGLKTLLDQFLQRSGGQVMQVLVVPDFHTQITIEDDIQDMKDLKMLLSIEEGPYYCCIPNKYKNPEKFDQQMEHYDDLLIEETMKPYIPSGHAFVCFDSVKSLNLVIKEFDMTAGDYCKLACFSIKDKCESCFTNQYNPRMRSRSTLFQNQSISNQETEAYGNGENFLMVERADEPLDILWKNIKGTKGGFIFRRLFLFILGLVIIIFVSSPVVLFNNLQVIDKTGLITLEWVPSNMYGNFVKKHGPPLMIICINLIILVLLDIASIIECYDTHSKYQRSIYLKCFIYLMLNMMIIPALTLNSPDQKYSLYVLITERDFSITDLLAQFYVNNSGLFFVSLIIQQACLSSAFYLTNMSEIVFSYFSPWLALEKRKIFQDSAPWRRKEQLTFQYGYFYAQLMTIFAICIFFSSTIPLVTIASAFYAMMRHFVDCLQLITYFRKEIESSGRLIESVTNTALIIVMCYQICMMAFFAREDMSAEALVCTLIFVVSIFYTVISYESVYDLSAISEELETGKHFTDDMLQRWRADYEHPLVVSSVRRKAKTMGQEIRQLDDWQQFVSDSRVQDLLAAGNYSRQSGIFKMTDEVNAKERLQKKRNQIESENENENEQVKRKRDQQAYQPIIEAPDQEY